MSRKAVSSVCQLAVILWCIEWFAASAADGSRAGVPEGLEGNPWINGLAILVCAVFYGIPAFIMFVSPRKMSSFFAPNRLGGGELYFCAIMRVLLVWNLIESLSFTLVLFSANYQFPGTGSLGRFSVIALTPTVIDIVFIILAPWIARFVIGQVRSGTMWYSVISEKLRRFSLRVDD